MPVPYSYDYAIVRVVPCLERGEFLNAGVVVHCPQRAYLHSRVHLDRKRLAALWPTADGELIHQHLQAFPRICAGEAGAGPIAKLSQRERFHWLVAPRSTIIQVSPVHSGLCAEPETTLDELFARLVLIGDGNHT